jgi:hypothetical protein
VTGNAHDCLAAALDYAARGWSVVPVKPHAKTPLVAWQEFQDRHADAAQLRVWWRRWPDANVGIVTGPVSRLIVLDIDRAHGGEASLRDWQERHGPLPPTLEAISGGGGRHLYFMSADPALRNRIGLLPGVDLRARGGLIVAPPSVHPSGARYRWRDGRSPAERPALPLPAHLHAWLGDRTPRGQPVAHWRGLVRDGVAEGARNSTIASLCGHLLWYGVDPEVALELLLAWNRARCRPPLDDAEVAEVVASISRLHERDAGPASGS